MARKVAIAGCILAALAVVSPAARASSTQASIMEDDHLLLYSGAATRERALDQMQALGVTTLHALVVWRYLAPAPGSFDRPAFDATDPAAYSGWESYDDLVAGAAARGMKVLFTPTGPVPEWASECSRRATRRWRCRPRPSDYAAFVKAVGARYSGTYSSGGQVLPRVSAWSLWNEPNHKAWLVPQTERRGGVTLYTGAARYRRLVTGALASLAATGHAGDELLIGETAPGGGRHSIAPVDFMRELFCLDTRYRPYRGTAARIRGCAPLPHLPVTGISDHPYTYAAVASPSAFRGKSGDAPIGSVDRLVTLVDRAARYGIVRPGLPLWLTEFGFQTRPPDPYGISLSLQAQFLNYADYVAYSNPRIASTAQFELRDDPRVGVFNTGLCFAGGRAKPALRAYATPIWVTRDGAGRVRVFGLARAARGTRPVVAIQNRRAHQRSFQTVARVRTNRAGYFLTRLRDRGGRWRLMVRTGGTMRYSRVA